MQIAAIIPADPSNPVMIRWVRLLYFEIADFTKNAGESNKQKINMMDQWFLSEVRDSVSKYNTVAPLLTQDLKGHIEAALQFGLLH